MELLLGCSFGVHGCCVGRDPLSIVEVVAGWNQGHPELSLSGLELARVATSDRVAMRHRH